MKPAKKRQSLAGKDKKPNYLESESEEEEKPVKKESAISKKAKKEPSVSPAYMSLFPQADE